MTKYHMANAELPSANTTRLAALSGSERKIRSGISGSSARRASM